MDFLPSYLLKAILASGIFYGYYCLALRNKQFHSYNRFYLLLSVVASLVLPLLNFSWLYIEAPVSAPLQLFSAGTPGKWQPVTTAWYESGMMLFGFSALVSSCLIILLLIKIRWIYKLRRRSKTSQLEGFVLVETDVEQAPFSFANNLFWKNSLNLTDAGSQKIFNHELAHIRQGHTYDKLFTQLTCCFCWMNPFYWLIHKELDTIHEFMADQAAIEHGDSTSFANMLLQSYSHGCYSSPSHAFFNSSIKRRLIMITTSKNTRYSYARRILALPIGLFIVFLLSISLKAQIVHQLQSAPKEKTADTIPTLTKPALERATVKGYKVSGKKVAGKKVPASSTRKQAQQTSRVQGHLLATQEAQALTTLNAAQNVQQKVITQQLEAVRTQLTTVTALQQNLEAVTADNLVKPINTQALAAAQQNIQQMTSATQQLNQQVTELSKTLTQQNLQEVKVMGQKIATKAAQANTTEQAIRGLSEVQVTGVKTEKKPKSKKHQAHKTNDILK